MAMLWFCLRAVVISVLTIGTCMLILVTGGCSGASSHDTRQAESDAAAGPPVILVNVVVLTRDDGTGNALWDIAYVQALLAAAATYAGEVVRFQLQHLTALASTADYARNQQPLLYGLRTLSMPGVVTVLISQPETTDYAGFSFVLYAARPIFVIRARVQEWSGLAETSRIFLHELSHNFALVHADQTTLPYHADNYYVRDDGRQQLVDYSAFLGGE